jgi:hypothetical protein
MTRRAVLTRTCGWPVYGADDPSRAVQALRAQAEKVTAHAAWTR